MKPKEFAELIGVSVKTLQRWDEEKTLIVNRNPKGRRFYTYGQYEEYMGIASDKSQSRKIVLYTRVSGYGQKDDMSNQVDFLRNYVNAKGIIPDEVIKDIGSGLNYKRKKWNILLDEVMDGKASHVYVTHKDRFVRFGFDWFESLLEKNGTKLIVVNNEDLSPQEELVQDLISIIHVFSCRIYGLRKYKSQIKEDEEVVESIQDRDPTD
ncbi:IS607 family transposase [Exiguobacterium flavidum]|uniref:IS607 family transposase n=1 Tax=Exiguobacterium flavidum TaxID=2184695 RepID=UPI000DF7CC20|nr:IS607 family transposase [Exiguobacterium flavidum]